MTEHEHQPQTPAQPEHEASRESPRELHPRVWIGSLADYNNGTLTGEWVDAAVDGAELSAAARAIVANSEQPDAEEWAIFDHDEFGSWTPGESEDLHIVARVARGIAEHGAAFAAWAELHDADEAMLDSFSDAYLGAYDSAEAWAETVMDDLGVQTQIEEALPGDIARYVRLDSGAWAQDAWLSGDVAIVHRPGGGVWIFDSRL